MDTLQALSPTAAATCAARNWAANLRALADTQPRLASCLPPPACPPEWVFGRDGTLTCFDAFGRWEAGCSLPYRAALAMLRTLTPQGTLGCFLNPAHAGQLRVAFEKAGPRQAVLALVPDARAAWVMLHCEDFSPAVAARRLWFACGEGWADEMRRLFADHPGLPTPHQFIRTATSEVEALQPLITGAQKVFSDVIAARAAEAARLRRAWSPSARSPRRVCVAAASRFGLWEDAGLALAETLSASASAGVEWVNLWPDKPASASPLALAAAAANCDGIVAANFSRADVPDLLPPDVPWVTWLTTPAKLPPAATAGPNDSLLVADPAWAAAAVRAGWAADRVAVAGWPPLAGEGIALCSGAPVSPRTGHAPSPLYAEKRAGVSGLLRGSGHAGPRRPRESPHPNPLPCVQGRGDQTGSPLSGTAPKGESAAASEPYLSLIADTRPTDPPAALDDYSSHRLLWETIRRELADDYTAAGDDPAAYLDRQARRYGVADEGLDRGLFLEGLIFPAYAQAVARQLLGAGLPVRFHGGGWTDLDEFSPYARGPVEDRAALRRAVAGSAAAVHCWPARHIHPLDAAGRPVVRAAGRRKGEFVAAARAALAEKTALPPRVESVSAGHVLQGLFQD